MSSQGWYTDPAGSGQLRYFDGINWTDQLKPVETSNNINIPVEEVGDIFSFSQETNNSWNDANQPNGYTDNFISPVNLSKNQDEDFSKLKELDDVKVNKKRTGSSKRKSAENYAHDRSYISKVFSVFKKLAIAVFLLVIVVGLVGRFTSGESVESSGDLGKVSENVAGEAVSKEPVVSDEEDKIDVPKEPSTTVETPGKAMSNGEALVDSAVALLRVSIEKNGAKISRKSENKVLELMLNPNGSVKISGAKGTGYGDGKYLYLPKTLILDIENDKDTRALFQTQGKSIIRMSQNNGQIGSTLFSAKYYDGANFPKFYDNLKDDISKVTRSVEGSFTVLEVTTSGGNDWFKLYLENGIIKKVLIDEGSSYEVAMTFDIPGKTKIIIPKSGYIKF